MHSAAFLYTLALAFYLLRARRGPKLSQPAAGHKVQHLLPIAPPACPHTYTFSPQTNLQSIFISSFLGLRRLIFFPRIPRTCSQNISKYWKGLARASPRLLFCYRIIFKALEKCNLVFLVIGWNECFAHTILTFVFLFLSYAHEFLGFWIFSVYLIFQKYTQFIAFIIYMYCI